MTASHPTASTFREALLRSLGTATGLQADNPIKMKVVLPLVYKDSGIAEDAFGKDVNGWFKVRLWVQQTYKILRRQNLAIKAGRGNWALSTEGVTVAATLMGVPVPVQPLPVQPLPTPAPSTPAPAATPAADDLDLDDLLAEFTPVADSNGSDDTVAEDALVTPEAPDVDSTPAPVAADAHEGGEGVAYTLGAQVNRYNSDPYIRGLAIESTGCFGEFSSRSTICKGCPLSGACKATILTRLSGIAAKLHKRDSDEAARALRPAQTLPPAPEPDEDDIDAIIAAIEDEVVAPAAQATKGTKMKVPADGKCRGCSKKVSRGTDAMYERGVGIYHLNCHANK